MNTTDTLIVGAGMAGASLAWRLAQRGHAVTLLERESQQGAHSTGRSAAMFMESYGPPQVRALTRAGRSFYLQPPAGFTDDVLVSPRAALIVGRPEQSTELEATWAALSGGGTRVRRLSGAEAVALLPVLAPEQIGGAVLDEDGYDMDVNALLQGFLRGARTAGAQLRVGAEVVSARHDGAVWTVQLASGETLQARTLVNAAGAWVDELAQRAGARPIGIEPLRRSAFTFRAPEHMDPSGWPMAIDVDESWYLKPDAGQLLGSPANADPTTPHDVQPEELDIATGIYRIEEMTTLRIHRPTATWAGLRSFVHDGEIVIGFDAQLPRFFWLAAQGGYGIQSAAGASLLAVSQILGDVMAPDLAVQGVNAQAVSPSRLR
ncbi:FAD-binding oxidoreductase [Ottowia sp. GY511]|uniref:NAD(P)/FAD-dependent oxidoreductase n=1 Tax=Ottowia flava TaxID=2675430 RepID=A0ABW4KT38_9BURK|nr:FAD-binding oxidoreductase [Ottowia sp. GY511]TXK21596.1 FAD-binding oxidoreductase [Ottowia sp. GY511]